MTQAVRIALITLGSVLAVVVLAMAMLVAGGAAKDVDGAGAVPEPEAVETTAPATVEHELVVASPQLGDVITSPLLVDGRTTVDQLGYRLVAAGSLLIEGTIEVAEDGSFVATVEFTNNCCIEMTLEVFTDAGIGLGVSIPLTYPESS